MELPELGQGYSPNFACYTQLVSGVHFLPNGDGLAPVLRKLFARKTQEGLEFLSNGTERA